jgi:hypothetical protein
MDDGGDESAPWVGYEELARLLGEPMVEAVYPVNALNEDERTELDFSWLVDDFMPEAEAPSTSISPVLSVSRDEVKGEQHEEHCSDEGEVNDKEIDTFVGFESRKQSPSDPDIDAALDKNRQCQKIITEMLESVQAEMAAVSKCMSSVREFRETYPMLFSTTKAVLEDPIAMLLKHADFIGLSADERSQLMVLQEQDKDLQRTTKWTREQRRQLAKGVRQQNQKLLMERVLETGSGDLAKIHHDIDRIKRMEERELEMNLEGLDFDRISRFYVPKKTPLECEMQWRHVDHPSINHSEQWTSKELEGLKRFGGDPKVSWEEVAAKLGTNRTAFSCVCQYQRLYAPHTNKGKWQKEEDELLEKAVKRHGQGDWMRIAALVPGRSAQQCIHRWRNTLAPTIRRGRWSPQEDQLLLEAVKDNPGASWQVIAQHVPGRTDVKCRERWVNVLDPGVLRTAFSADEDEVLRRAVQEVGEGRWAAIAVLLPGRTDNQCRRRWRYLSRSTNSTRGSKKSK